MKYSSLALRLSLLSFLASSATFASIIFLPLFARDLRANNFQIGALVSIYGGTYFASSIYFGRQSDIQGRVRFIRLGLGLSVLAFLSQTLMKDVYSLMVVRGLVGVCLGATMAALTAYTYERIGHIGSFAAFGALGWAFASLAAAILGSYHALFILSGAFTACGFILALSLQEPETRISQRPPTFDIFKRNYRVYLPFLLRHTGAGAIWAIFPLYLSDLGASKFWIGVLYFINMGGQFPTMRWVERFREARLFGIGLILSAGVFLGFGLATDFRQFFILQVFISLAWSCLYIGALLLLLKNNQERATATGLLYSMVSLGTALGPFLAGSLAQLWGFRPVMFSAVLLSVAGWIVSQQAFLPKAKLQAAKGELPARKRP